MVNENKILFWSGLGLLLIFYQKIIIKRVRIEMRISFHF
jgi:hypothetical protein